MRYFFQQWAIKRIVKHISLSRATHMLEVTLTKNINGLDEVLIDSDPNKIGKEILNVNKLGVQGIDVPVTAYSVNAKVMEQRNVSDLGDAVKKCNRSTSYK